MSDEVKRQRRKAEFVIQEQRSCETSPDKAEWFDLAGPFTDTAMAVKQLKSQPEGVYRVIKVTRRVVVKKETKTIVSDVE